jgi:dipeptidase E
MSRLFLLSNSTQSGRGYLDHAMPELLAFLGGPRRVAFVPFALKDRRGYAAKVAERFATEGVRVVGLSADARGVKALAQADAVFVGGGNTFRLVDALQRSGLLAAIRKAVQGGMPYVGSSAGTNVAAPTIRTTNDMPIVQPRRFDAIGLVPFQINPHYLDADPRSTHMGETREQRLREYLEENAVPVLALREGAWLWREGATLRLQGARGARLFRRGREPQEYAPGADLSFLLKKR